MSELLRPAIDVDGRRIHRFQVVRERRVGDGGDEGSGSVGEIGEVEGSNDAEGSGDVVGSRGEEWIVVGFDDGGEAVRLADPDFDWVRSVPTDAFRSGRFEPLAAGGVPVWGY